MPPVSPPDLSPLEQKRALRLEMLTRMIGEITTKQELECFAVVATLCTFSNILACTRSSSTSPPCEHDHSHRWINKTS